MNRKGYTEFGYIVLAIIVKITWEIGYNLAFWLFAIEIRFIICFVYKFYELSDGGKVPPSI